MEQELGQPRRGARAYLKIVASSAQIGPQLVLALLCLAKVAHSVRGASAAVKAEQISCT